MNPTSCRYYRIAGITIQVGADLPLTDQTFEAHLEQFRVDGPGEDTISLHHHFSLPNLAERELGQEVYRRPPWAIYHQSGSWVYVGILPPGQEPNPYQVSVFDEGHTHGEIYHARDDLFRVGNHHSLTLFPSDQILLARVLADRQACYLHAAGMILGGRGYAFVGHSEAGKSTTVTMLQEQGEILCDDRVIARRWPEGFRVHGTWSHGDVPTVSPASAPLRAMLFLEQAPTNRALPLESKEVARRLPFYVVRPLVTAEWWEKTLAVVEKLAQEVPAYRLQLDKSGRVREVLRDLSV